MSEVTYQYWQHKRSGETYAVQLVNGEAAYLCGPLHYREYVAHAPEDFEFDEPFEDSPDDYVIAYIQKEV